MSVTSVRRRGVRVVAAGAAIAAALTLCLRAAPRGDAEVQFQLGTQLFGEARYGEALDAFNAALETDDQSLAVRARKGKIRAALRVGEFSVARREAETLNTATSADPEAMAIYGDALWS